MDCDTTTTTTAMLSADWWLSHIGRLLVRVSWTRETRRDVQITPRNIKP